MPPNALRGVSITTLGAYKDFTSEKLKRWIEAQGGHFDGKKLTQATTHLVIHEDTWKAGNPAVKEALEASEAGHKIKIVSWDWLEDSLRGLSKKREHAYEWMRLDAPQQKRKNRSEDGITSVKGMMGEMFTEETAKYVTEQERKEFEKAAAQERRARREQEESDKMARKQAQKMSKNELTASFQWGRKSRRETVFSTTHHVYRDAMGFAYEVVLTKALAKQNRNERVVLTLYETNDQPETYALNSQSAATGKKSENNIICAIGTNFETAFRAFGNAFKQQVGYDWDRRMSVRLERKDREAAERERRMQVGGGSQFPTGSSVRKTLVQDRSEEAKARERAEDEKAFKETKFQYDPPAYGPRGLMSPSEMKCARELFEMDQEDEDDNVLYMARASGQKQNLTTQKRNEVEGWVSGANPDATGTPRYASPTILGRSESFDPNGQGYDLDAFIHSSAYIDDDMTGEFEDFWMGGSPGKDALAARTAPDEHPVPNLQDAMHRGEDTSMPVGGGGNDSVSAEAELGAATMPRTSHGGDCEGASNKVMSQLTNGADEGVVM